MSTIKKWKNAKIKRYVGKVDSNDNNMEKIISLD